MSYLATKIKGWNHRNGWHISPGVAWCPKGYHIRIGSKVEAGTIKFLGDYVNIGNNTEIGVDLIARNNVFIGPGVLIEHNVVLEHDVVVERNATLESDVSLSNDVTIDQYATLARNVRIGVGTYVQKKAVVCMNANISNNVTIGEGVTIPNAAEIGRYTRIPKGYKFICTLGHADYYTKTILKKDGVAYITAGCRLFTLEDAIAHWGRYKKTRTLTNCLLHAAKEIARLEHLRPGKRYK